MAGSHNTPAPGCTAQSLLNLASMAICFGLWLRVGPRPSLLRASPSLGASEHGQTAARLLP
jgi:hypothetical protein